MLKIKFTMKSFFDESGHFFLDFLSPHRGDGFPDLISMFKRDIEGFTASGVWVPPEDMVWRCSCDSGSFTIYDEWDELHIVPESNHENVLKKVMDALIDSGEFDLVSSAG